MGRHCRRKITLFRIVVLNFPHLSLDLVFMKRKKERWRSINKSGDKIHSRRGAGGVTELMRSPWSVSGLRCQHDLEWGFLCVLSCFSPVWPWNAMDCSPLDSSVHGVPQARILQWVAIPSSRGSSQPGDQTRISYDSCVGRQVLHY